MAGLSTRKLPAVLLGLFAAVALMLALLGIYGVISYSVSQRTNEIGIRIALGAERADVFYLVVVQGMTPVWAGLIAGVCIAAALSRTLSVVLYGVQTHRSVDLWRVVSLATSGPSKTERTHLMVGRSVPDVRPRKNSTIRISRTSVRIV
ncbi:MAG: FtsX-like permease family protein [Bryobacteraceae bacterium]